MFFISLNVTLDDVESKVAAVLDQNEATSAISTADYSLRRAYINMAQREWAETYDWKGLYKESNSKISTSTGNASVAMPSDFRKLATYPAITYDGSTTAFFPEIRPEEGFQYPDISKYIYVLGNQNTGFTMVINSGLSIISKCFS